MCKLFFILSLCLAVLAGTLALTCSEGYVVDECPTGCHETCPTSEAEEKKVCEKPAVCPPAKCVCPVNKRRDNETGQCINTRDCPEFSCPGVNQAYNPCPANCPNDCSMAPYNGSCPPLYESKILLICRPTCYCAPGYYRDSNGICIDGALCPTA